MEKHKNITPKVIDCIFYNFSFEVWGGLDYDDHAIVGFIHYFLTVFYDNGTFRTEKEYIGLYGCYEKSLHTELLNSLKCANFFHFEDSLRQVLGEFLNNKINNSSTQKIEDFIFLTNKDFENITEEAAIHVWEKISKEKGLYKWRTKEKNLLR